MKRAAEILLRVIMGEGIATVKRITACILIKSPLAQRSVYLISKEFLGVLTKSLPQPPVNHLPNMTV
jgi:hypothetical protein